MNSPQTRRNNALRILTKQQRMQNMPEYAQTISTLATASRSMGQISRDNGNTLNNVRNYGRFLAALKKLHKLILDVNTAFFRNVLKSSNSNNNMLHVHNMNNEAFVPIYSTKFQKMWDQLNVCDDLVDALEYLQTSFSPKKVASLYDDLHNHMLVLAPMKSIETPEGIRYSVPKIETYDDVIKGMGFTGYFQLWCENIIPLVENWSNVQRP